MSDATAEFATVVLRRALLLIEEESECLRKRRDVYDMTARKHQCLLELQTLLSYPASAQERIPLLREVRQALAQNCDLWKMREQAMQNVAHIVMGAISKAARDELYTRFRRPRGLYG